METSPQFRGRGLKVRGAASGGRQPLSRNRHWIAPQLQNGHSNDSERRERGGHQRGRGDAGRTSGRRHNTHLTVPDAQHEGGSGTEDELDTDVIAEADEPELNTAEEREQFYQELVKAREIERKRAITEGMMDDPLVPKRLDEAITMVGTCMDMCPRFERYRRERENNLDKWEVIPGTKRVDHKRAVKIYERAAGDKTLPSDLRPPPVLKRTLDYLFHDLLMRGGFSQTYDFIRDRSRAVRNDFTMQHETGQLAMECHDRCARFHILALHLERDSPRFSVALEEQQLMNTLQSLKEFYEDQRGRYQSPTELEMRVYHRLIHIRDQRERPEVIPDSITTHPVFQLTSQFRVHVQTKSAPISKTSRLIVDAEGMQIFAQLVAVLREQNNIVMIYLVACILERLFGKDTIEDLESIRGNLSIPDTIDGISAPRDGGEVSDVSIVEEDDISAHEAEFLEEEQESASLFGPSQSSVAASSSLPTSSPFSSQPSGASSSLPPQKPIVSAFSNIKTTPNVFGNATTFGAFGGATSSVPQSAFSSSGAKPLSGAPTLIIEHNESFASRPPISSNSPFQPSQPTWGSSGATGTSSFVTPPKSAQTFLPNATASPPNTLSLGATTPPSSVLNPLAPTFSPLTTRPLASTPPSNGFFRPQANVTPSPQVEPSPTTKAQTNGSFLQFTNAPPTQTVSESLTPKIVERRQTLWELPSSSASPPQSDSSTQPYTPRLIIPNEASSPRTASPAIPPLLGKVEPISLPPTPTVRWFDPGSQQQSKLPDNITPGAMPKQRSMLNLQMPSFTSSGMLSPLHLGSPQPSFTQAANDSPTPLHRPSVPSPLSGSVLNGSASPAKGPTNGHVLNKGKAKATEVDRERDLEAEALSFLCKGTVVRKYFKLWLQRTIDRAAWAEACRRSDAYQQKVQRERLSSSTGSASDARKKQDRKKRRVSLGEPFESRRVKRRVSNKYVAPITDEELAKRLRENHTENEKRWTQGSFLQAIRAQLQSASREVHTHWRIWLSLNPENDGTAIWLEHKLDLPTSGIWVSETIFSMPIKPEYRELQSLSPGLIIFERTPLGGLHDTIERKYRILDDCARLREVIQRLAPAEDRHFLPVLCTIIWEEDEVHNDIDDFTDMTKKSIEEGRIKSAHIFPVSTTTKDLDQKFRDALGRMPLDTEDKLVQKLTWKELTRLFASTLKTHAMSWLESCWTDESFSELRFHHVLESIVSCDEALVSQLMDLAAGQSSAGLEVPPELQAYPELERNYGVEAFVDAHVKFAIRTVERSLAQRLQLRYALQTDKLQHALHEFESAVHSETNHLDELGSALYADGTYYQTADGAATDMNVEAESPSPVRTTVSVSPPPSISVASTMDVGEKPAVTVAMLRALTKDILRTYRKK